MDVEGVAAGVAVGAVAWLGKVALELARGRRNGNGAAPVKATLSTSTLAAVVDLPRVARQVDTVHDRLEDVHEIVTTRDADGVPRVLNKPSVEKAILDTARHAERQTTLLESIAESIRPYRDRLPTGGGE